MELACTFHLASCAPLAYSRDRASTSDHRLIRKLISRLRKKDLVLIDNGFYYLQTFLKIRQRQAHFVVPAKRSHRPKVLSQLGLRTVCRIQSQDQTLTVRVLYLQRKGFRRRRLVTSLLDPLAFPAQEFSDLYHLRWSVEAPLPGLQAHSGGHPLALPYPGDLEQELLVHLITVGLIRKVMLDAAAQGRTIPVARLSSPRSLAQIRVFFRRLGSPAIDCWQQLYDRLVQVCATFWSGSSPAEVPRATASNIARRLVVCSEDVAEENPHNYPPLLPSRRFDAISTCFLSNADVHSPRDSPRFHGSAVAVSLTAQPMRRSLCQPLPPPPGSPHITHSGSVANVTPTLPFAAGNDPNFIAKWPTTLY